ncbi:MAG: hypothetical protein N3A02_05520, partial [Rectinema sp.]|nr:hypothetical protein [Rectinema sp.]
MHIEVQDHTAFINGMPFQTHTSFPEWEALKLAIEQAALSAHGAHIQLIGKFSAIKELDAYLRRVAWIRERAFE